MKINKTLKRKQFLHLSKEAFNDPLLPLIEFCYDISSLDSHRNDIHRFTRASCCHNVGFRPVDFSKMQDLYKRLCSHIELLYLLMHRYPDWKISTFSPFYQCRIAGNLKTILDKDLFDDATMRFTALGNDEFTDLQIFMCNFFRFKSLRKWRKTMDNLFELVFDHESFAQYHEDAHYIFEYLDKLGEAIFVAYEIRGKSYLLEHHANRFYIKPKQLVDIEPPITNQ